MLRSRYFERLGFSVEDADALSTPSKENLDKIIEAHLDKITFDNLSQHGLPMTASLDIEMTATKILDHGRGGFCFELNGLLGEFLTELGYAVRRIPAIVHVPELEFRHKPAHLVLVASAPQEGSDGEEWFVDVGFGEPAINSLKYELGSTQSTPEGMKSRLLRDPDDPNAVILEWKQDDAWLPRLKWDFDHPGQAIETFQPGLDSVLSESSIFHQKLIVCRIDRNEKVSLAGTRLKRTAPRFGPERKATVEELETPEDVKKALEDVFNVPNPEDLNLEKSQQAEAEVWSQM